MVRRTGSGRDEGLQSSQGQTSELVQHSEREEVGIFRLDVVEGRSEVVESSNREDASRSRSEKIDPFAILS